MVPDQFQIIEAFLDRLDTSLTINQISKKIKKSYAYTNKYTHELIEKSILKTLVVGNAILCSLNYQNKVTIASLVYLSIKERPDKINELKTDSIVLYYKKKLYSFGKQKEKSSLLLSDKDFQELIENSDLSKIKILQHPEKFWEKVSELVT